MLRVKRQDGMIIPKPTRSMKTVRKRTKRGERWRAMRTVIECEREAELTSETLNDDR